MSYKIIVMAALASACSTLSAQTVLTFAHSTAVENPRHIAALKFAELVERNSKGHIKVEVSPASKLGDESVVLEKMVRGEIDISANSQGTFSKYVPEYANLGLPYIFDTTFQVWRVLAGPIGKELSDKADAQGFVLLEHWDNGFRHITNSKRPINHPNDLKGLKMRTPPDPTTIAFMNAVGAQPIAIKFSELYEALKNGTVDGQENPLINIYTQKMFEVQKYLTLSNHKFETTPLLISKVTWNKLNANDQKILKEAAIESTKLQRDLMQKAEERMFSRLSRSGMTLGPVFVEQFAAASAPVIKESLAGPTGEFTKNLLAAVKAARAAK